MSYILDALKKSQKQRRRGSVPDVLTVQEIMVQQPAGRRLWRIVAACMAVLVVLALIWFFERRGWDTRKTATPSSVSGPAAVSPDMPVVSRKIPDRSGNDPEDGQRGAGSLAAHGNVATETDHPETRKKAPEQAAKPDVPAANVRSALTPVPKNAPVEPPERAAEPLPTAENRLYRLQELPDQLRRALPEFAITAFMYSGQPSSRMVRINGRLMKEGEELPPGVRLDEITPEGVVLKYRGYRFVVFLK
jgi:general secretion pathway protein B